MDTDRIDELAKDPRLIPGIFNYCDQWCERCPFTSRCMNYALGEEECDDPESQDIKSQEFWDTLHGIFEATIEMVMDKAEEMGIDLDAAEFDEITAQQEHVRETAKEQPCCRAAMTYVRRVDDWFDSTRGLLENKADELESLAQADIPGTKPTDEAANICDCLDVIRWYQRQIYVKLCRAAGGAIRCELEGLDYAREDADGSAKVALIGIERSIAAWAALLPHLPDQEPQILNLLATLERLLRQVEAAFPNARAFRRPGFDDE